nr:MAG TPA: hypothetical protein [Caudoviricetes sp.]
MKQPTRHRVTLSIDEMESLFQKMRENRLRNETLSSRVTVDLDYDTDYETLRIADHSDNAYQYNSYGECNGKRFTI